MQKIKILVVDDHKLMRESLQLFFSTDNSFEVIGTSGSGEEAINFSDMNSPDVVTMDINLPGITGIEAATIISQKHPDIKILCVSEHKQPFYARKMLQAGAMGYITKNSSSMEFLTAMNEITQGRKFLCQEVKDLLSLELIDTDSVTDRINSLTPREFKIIQCIKQGDTSKEIADQLGISEKTVTGYRHRIFRKLNLKNSAALIHFIHEHEVALQTVA